METTGNSQIDDFNKKLKDVYSSEVFSGRPIFRLVFSNDYREKRLGEFVDTDSNNNFVRRVTEVRDMLKYPYLKDTWILEKLVWMGGLNPELPEAKGYSYECIWAFVNKHGEPLYPHYHIVEMIINSLLNGKVERKTDAHWDAEEREKMEREEAEYFEILKEEGRSDLFAFEDFVFLDSTKRFGANGENN